MQGQYQDHRVAANQDRASAPENALSNRSGEDRVTFQRFSVLQAGHASVLNARKAVRNDNWTTGTGAYTMNITNNLGGTIQGDNDSGINIDGLNGNERVTIVNHGTAIPEPSAFAAVLGLAALGVTGIRRFRRRAH